MFNNRWLRLRSATTTEKKTKVQQYQKIKSKKVASAPLSHHYRKINYIQQYPKITSKKSGFGFAQPPLQKNNTQPNNTQKANQKKWLSGAEATTTEKQHIAQQYPKITSKKHGG